MPNVTKTESVVPGQLKAATPAPEAPKLKASILPGSPHPITTGYREAILGVDDPDEQAMHLEKVSGDIKHRSKVRSAELRKAHRATKPGLVELEGRVDNILNNANNLSGFGRELVVGLPGFPHVGALQQQLTRAKEQFEKEVAVLVADDPEMGQLAAMSEPAGFLRREAARLSKKERQVISQDAATLKVEEGRVTSKMNRDASMLVNRDTAALNRVENAAMRSSEKGQLAEDIISGMDENQLRYMTKLSGKSASDTKGLANFWSMQTKDNANLIKVISGASDTNSVINHISNGRPLSDRLYKAYIEIGAERISGSTDPANPKYQAAKQYEDRTLREIITLARDPGTKLEAAKNEIFETAEAKAAYKRGIDDRLIGQTSEAQAEIKRTANVELATRIVQAREHKVFYSNTNSWPPEVLAMLQQLPSYQLALQVRGSADRVSVNDIVYIMNSKPSDIAGPEMQMLNKLAVDAANMRNKSSAGFNLSSIEAQAPIKKAGAESILMKMGNLLVSGVNASLSIRDGLVGGVGKQLALEGDAIKSVFK